MRKAAKMENEEMEIRRKHDHSMMESINDYDMDDVDIHSNNSINEVDNNNGLLIHYKSR